VTHDTSASGFAPRGDLYQAIPISVFIDAIVEIVDHGFLYVNTESKYRSIANSYIRDGVASGNFVPLMDTRRNIMGVLSISFSERKDKLTDEERKKLQEFSVRIAYLLEDLAVAYRHPRRRAVDA